MRSAISQRTDAEPRMSLEKLPSELRETESKWRSAIAACADKLGKSAIAFVPSEGGGWIDSAIEVATGQTITLLGAGQVWLSREANLAFPPSVGLWYRIGDSPIMRCVSNTSTFIADRTGPLHLIAKPPGEWADAQGNFLAEYPHAGASGGFIVAVVVWSGDIDAGLSAFASHDTSGIAQAERLRRASEKPLPGGWTPLWRLGQNSTFHEDRAADGHRMLACRCDNDAAIVKYPVDVAIDDNTRLAWSWRVDKIPSQHPENGTATHDYLSIAVEFENGQDLTYYWSAALPVGTSFRCPLSWWDKYETHIVARSGASELGRWISEEKPILEDYRKAVGGATPRRAVGVWLIAVSAFQRGIGQAAYRDMQLKAGGVSLWIGP
jgi:DUF3047 family protein